MPVDLLGIGLGALGQEYRAGKAHSRSKELMGMQYGNQRSLNQQGQELQMDMWNKTNYAAQMKHMKEAGLSPGLMYGKGGAGGATTGSQGGGSAAMGQSHAPMDIQGAMQAGMMKSQMENLDSVTALNKKKLGTEDTIQDLNNAKKRMTNLSGDKLIEETRIIEKEYEIKANEAEVSSATIEEEKRKIRGEAVLVEAQGELAKSGKMKNEAEIQNMADKIKQNYILGGVDAVMKIIQTFALGGIMGTFLKKIGKPKNVTTKTRGVQKGNVRTWSEKKPGKYDELKAEKRLRNMDISDR